MTFPHFVVYSDYNFVSVCQVMFHQGYFSKTDNLFLMLVSKREVELKVMKNCLLDLQKMIIIKGGRVSLMLFHYEKIFVTYNMLKQIKLCD